MKKSKNKFNLILYSVLIIVLTCAVIVGGVLYMNGAVAWFAKNRRVQANGMAVNLKDLGITDLYYVRYDNKDGGKFTKVSGNAFTFTDLTPGDSVTIMAVYLSDSNDTRRLDIQFKDMGGGEKALVKDGKYYYFGTQLKVTKKALNGGAAEEVNKFLVEPPEYIGTADNPDKPDSPDDPNDPGSYIYYKSEVAADKINDIGLASTSDAATLENGAYSCLAELANSTDADGKKLYDTATNTLNGVIIDGTKSDISLNDYKVRVLEFTVKFENYKDISQNDYQDFGSNGEKCTRHLVTSVYEN